MPPPITHSPPFHTWTDLTGFLDGLDYSVMKMGTDRIERVLALLNHPQNRIKTIHIVGTNGKGSVTALLSAMYTAAGFQVGSFTSPHLVDIRERIRLNGQPLSQAMFLKAAQAVYPAMAEALPNPQDWLTYFEYLNAMAFWCFHQANVDVALIEAGLGGRLDSTNVISSPLAVVVTPISYDHTDRLGPTLTHIAREKAGVFKTEVPVITGFQPPEAMEALQETAQRHQSPLYQPFPDRLIPGHIIHDAAVPYRPVYDTQTRIHLSLPLLGHYQAENLALALTVIERLQSLLPLSQSAIETGLRHVTWPGRFQYLPHRQLIIDGSHNAAGFATLRHTLQADFPDTPVLFGITMLSNREMTNIMPLLTETSPTAIHFLHPNDPDRYHPAEAFHQWALTQARHAHVFTGPSPQAFCTMPVPPGTLKVLTGSLYTAGHVLGASPPL